MIRTKKLISLLSSIFLPFLTACISSAAPDNSDLVSSASTTTPDEVPTQTNPTNPSSTNEEKAVDDNSSLSDPTLVKESKDNSNSNNLNQTDKNLENQKPIDVKETKSKDPSIPEEDFSKTSETLEIPETPEPPQEIPIPSEQSPSKPSPSEVNDAPISEPVLSTPPIQAENELASQIIPNEYTQAELYSAVETRLQNGTKIKVLDALGQNQLPRKDVRLVPSKLSKLPSLWTVDEITNTLITTTDKVKLTKIEILDYSDALIYSSARTNFPHKNSVIEFTSTDGKNGFRIANYDAHDRLLDIDGTNVGSVYFLAIEYSWLKAKIQITDIHNQEYDFEEIFLFLEGIGELIEQKGNSIEDNIFQTTNVKNRFVSDTFQNWINQKANELNSSDELIRKIYYHFVTQEANIMKYTENLQFLTRIVHIKTTNPIENITKLSEFSVLNKKYQSLPSELSYIPELRKLDNSGVYMLINPTTITIGANNLNQNKDEKGIRWYNHGKPEAIDYYWRGTNDSNLSFQLTWFYINPFCQNIATSC